MTDDQFDKLSAQIYATQVLAVALAKLSGSREQLHQQDQVERDVLETALNSAVTEKRLQAIRQELRRLEQAVSNLTAQFLADLDVRQRHAAGVGTVTLQKRRPCTAIETFSLKSVPPEMIQGANATATGCRCVLSEAAPEIPAAYRRCPKVGGFRQPQWLYADTKRKKEGIKSIGGSFVFDEAIAVYGRGRGRCGAVPAGDRADQ